MRDALPTPAFVQSQLALLRSLQTVGAVAGPAGVTDVKLLRIIVGGGDNRTAVKIIGSASQSPAPTVTLSPSPTSISAQKLSVEDRACITSAVAKLPNVTALKIERSRVLPQPQAQGRRNPDLYHVMVEIDVSVAGQSSTYIFNCIRNEQLTVIQPMGMRSRVGAGRMHPVDVDFRLRDRSPTHGHEPTREATMKAFAKSWQCRGTD